jgi:hypothetical protein
VNVSLTTDRLQDEVQITRSLSSDSCNSEQASPKNTFLSSINDRKYPNVGPGGECVRVVIVRLVVQDLQ